MADTDLLGTEMTADEQELLALYRKLKALSTRDDHAPCVVSNLRFATAAMWQIVTDLGLEWEHPYDAGL